MIPADINTDGNFSSPISILQMISWSTAALASILVLIVIPTFQTDINNDEIASNPVIKLSTPANGSDSVSASSLPGISIITKISAATDAAMQKQNGFGISLGEGQSLAILSKRYRQISALNNYLFTRLEPRAVFVDSGSTLVARLIAGPFLSKQEAAITCGILNLPDGIICSTHPYGSDMMALAGNGKP